MSKKTQVNIKMKDVALVKRQFLNQNNKKDKEWDG
jgi:hypothetical protein